MRYLQIYLKTQPGGSRIHYFINSQIYCLSFQNKSTSVVDKSNMQMLQGDNKKTFIWRQSVWKIADVLIELFRMNSCFLFHRSNILLASDWWDIPVCPGWILCHFFLQNHVLSGYFLTWETILKKSLYLPHFYTEKIDFQQKNYWSVVFSIFFNVLSQLIILFCMRFYPRVSFLFSILFILFWLDFDIGLLCITLKKFCVLGRAQDSLETYTKRARLYNNPSTTTNNPSVSKQAAKMVHDELSATEYLNQLLQDKTTVSKMPKIFLHSERLLDEGKQLG